MPKPELAVLSGSLPPGCPVWLYRDLLERFGTLGVPVILDANSHALANAVESTRPPLYVKPNREELAEWAVRDLDGADDLIDAAREILCRGVRMAVVSLGPGGALFVTRDEAVWAWGAPEKIAGTVGAGDAMVAGLAAAWIEKADLERTARLATAFSLAKMTLFGANLPDRAVVEDLAARVSLESGSGIEAAIRRAEKTV